MDDQWRITPPLLPVELHFPSQQNSQLEPMDQLNHRLKAVSIITILSMASVIQWSHHKKGHSRRKVWRRRSVPLSRSTKRVKNQGRDKKNHKSNWITILRETRSIRCCLSLNSSRLIPNLTRNQPIIIKMPRATSKTSSRRVKLATKNNFIIAGGLAILLEEKKLNLRNPSKSSWSGDIFLGLTVSHLLIIPNTLPENYLNPKS